MLAFVLAELLIVLVDYAISVALAHLFKSFSNNGG